MQPQLADEPELELPPVLPHEPQPHGRQQPQPQPQPQPQVELPLPVDVPPTVPFCGVQVHVQVHDGFVVDVPPTEPLCGVQQGLQQRWLTKSGNVRPLKQPLQEEAILYPSRKIFGNCRSRVILCRTFPNGAGCCRNREKTSGA